MQERYTDAENANEKETLQGSIEHITYRNEQNGYTVMNVRTGRKRIVVVGILPFIHAGDSGIFTGKYILHPTYGQQFQCEYFERRVPENAAAILRYLSSGVIRGVGPSTAARIVDKFGNDSLDVIQNHPNDLTVIRGISSEKAYAISEEYNKQYSVRDIMLLLSAYDVSPETCVKINRILGSNATEQIKENPYILCREEIGFPFEKAERIAYDRNISKDHEMRLCAGVEYILRKNLLNGHTCLPKDKVIRVAIDLLESDAFRIAEICDRLTEEFRVSSVRIGDTVFLSLPEYKAAEEHIAARMLSIKSHIDRAVAVHDLEIEHVENHLGIHFETLQRQAIKQAFESGVLLLTGGPGTGKTTTLNAMIELFETRGADIELAAPTGRAAKRMTELTGREAQTIHRLLEVSWGQDEQQEFARNEKNPLDCDVIIIDEASMIDTLLFDNLLRALRLSCRIILVGDADQLPSVSAGNVLADLLASGQFPSIQLKKVFRQANESLIIANAHAIINHEPPDLSNKGKDFFLLRTSDRFRACDTVTKLCTERLPNAYGFDPFNDIQVLSPSRKTDCGTVNLNRLLQENLNPTRDERRSLNYKGIQYRVGDRVMQIKNNYDLVWQSENGESGSGIFNGDIGKIVEVDRRSMSLKVLFEDKTVTYLSENLDELEPAYAITVHKSQGSEFDCVVLSLFDVPKQLRYRNLLYTAITRAKKMLVIVGDEQIFTEMANNDRKTLRYTLLKDFLTTDEKVF